MIAPPRDQSLLLPPPDEQDEALLHDELVLQEEALLHEDGVLQDAAPEPPPESAGVPGSGASACIGWLAGSEAGAGA